MASRSVDRTLEQRRSAYAAEVQRLIEASFAVIRASGRLEPTVGEIVREAGLSNQAFYRHFRSKDELLVAVLDQGVARLQGHLQHRMERVESAEQKIREWIWGMLGQALDAEAAAATRPFALSRARLSELFAQDVHASEARLGEMLRQVIQSAADAGELPTADAERDAEVVYNLAMGWMQRKLAAPTSATREDAEHLIEFAMHGLHRGA